VTFIAGRSVRPVRRPRHIFQPTTAHRGTRRPAGKSRSSVWKYVRAELGELNELTCRRKTSLSATAARDNVDASLNIVGTVYYYSTVLIFYYSVNRYIETPRSTSQATHHTHLIDILHSLTHGRKTEVRTMTYGRLEKGRFADRRRKLSRLPVREYYTEYLRRVPRSPNMCRGCRPDYNMVYVIHYRVSAIISIGWKTVVATTDRISPRKYDAPPDDSIN